MNRYSETEKIRGYCPMCSCSCPTISHVENGVFVRVEPDEESPLACGLCPKALAGPELVYSKERLQYPMRRTRPKGDPDPGWQRISWDEALDIIASKLSEIKAKFGAEAVAVTRAAPGGSGMTEVNPWLDRFTHAFGSPNTVYGTHICQWHRDNCSAYTYGHIAGGRSQGFPDFEQAACILIWGNNVHATRSSLLKPIKKGLQQGAKLIVIDPREVEIAAMADLWLQISPSTDGALALGMINVMIEENLYDYAFVRDWTNAPFLVRSDTWNFLRASDLTDGGNLSSYVIVDSISKELKAHIPDKVLPAEPILDVTQIVRLAGGEEIECKTAFRLLRESTAEYTPERAEILTGVPKDKIIDAARMLGNVKPSCWYSWNGTEQNINASQTSRAMHILYAMTGSYDQPGGNVIIPRVPSNSIIGSEFLSPEADGKRLGFKERPLGPGSKSGTGRTQGYEVQKAILTGKPYPVKALLNFGRSLATSSPNALEVKEALLKLDFHVESNLFPSHTADFADILLPAASAWECWHVGINIHSSPLGEKAYAQLRPAVVPPRHESWPDIKIVFELAKRLGLGDKFWDGDIEAAFNYQLAPANITVEQLRMNPGGISIKLTMEYQKYNKKNGDGNLQGFPTPSKRIEIYSSTFKEHGYEPLSTWKDPFHYVCSWKDLAEKYPLILTVSKVAEYCHSQLRCIPSLRKRVPNPFLEINPENAREAGVKDKEWVRLETPYGSITLQAKLTEGIKYNVVCTQNGWWQACPELNLPAYDPFSPEGANVNLLYSSKIIDPLSGSVQMKGYPCNIRKASK